MSFADELRNSAPKEKNDGRSCQNYFDSYVEYFYKELKRKCSLRAEYGGEKKAYLSSNDYFYNMIKHDSYEDDKMKDVVKSIGYQLSEERAKIMKSILEKKLKDDGFTDYMISFGRLGYFTEPIYEQRKYTDGEKLFGAIFGEDVGDSYQKKVGERKLGRALYIKAEVKW